MILHFDLHDDKMYLVCLALYVINLVPSPPRLAAISLLVLKDEENAFWCLVAMVENIMPQDYYSKTLIASQVCEPEYLPYRCVNV